MWINTQSKTDEVRLLTLSGPGMMGGGGGGGGGGRKVPALISTFENLPAI